MSWNEATDVDNYVRKVTLHVSVWVEIYWGLRGRRNQRSRSTWACELKWSVIDLISDIWMSRSTWACELKFLLVITNRTQSCHAPRERVSWNCWQVRWTWFLQGHAPRERVSWNMIWQSAIPFIKCHAPRERVSWNEKSGYKKGDKTVTLHVSVWVEIEEEMLRVSMGESRSTWACELKWFVRGGMKPKDESRSTWACELKYSCYLRNSYRFCHAPRERVSWNIFYFKWCINLAVTLHVSVWVEMWKSEAA